MALLEIAGLKTQFATEEGVVHAVDGVDLSVERGEVLCLVGESGSGKTVASLSILGLIDDPPGRIVAGAIRFAPGGKVEPLDLLDASEGELRAIRGNRIAMVFQDPMTSLNPYLTIGTQLTEVLDVHFGLGGDEARARVVDALEDVGIAAPERRLDDFPHQLSGGMRQRVLIAMALLCEPDLLIADEPTTALDVTVQAQILALVAQLTAQRGLGVIWITHDLGVVARLADQVAVMYAGRIVERGSVADIFAHPAHPYTRALQRSIPSLDAPAGQRELAALEGLPPSLLAPPPGCPFRPRCEHAVAVCGEQYPGRREVSGEGRHTVHCHVEELPP